MKSQYTIKTGENLELKLTSNSVSSTSDVVAKIKKTNSTGSTPAASVQALLTLDKEDVSDGWIFTLSPTQTAALAAGYFLVDAAMTVNGFALKTDPVFIEIKNSVT